MKFGRCSVALAMAFLSGCLPAIKSPEVPVEQAKEVASITHKVAFPGETLGIISEWYTGSSGNWKKLLEFNKGIDIQGIRVGDTIRIPEAMLKRKKPLPESFVAARRLRGGDPLEEAAASNVDASDALGERPAVSNGDENVEAPNAPQGIVTAPSSAPPSSDPDIAAAPDVAPPGVDSAFAAPPASQRPVSVIDATLLQKAAEEIKAEGSKTAPSEPATNSLEPQEQSESAHASFAVPSSPQTSPAPAPIKRGDDYRGLSEELDQVMEKVRALETSK